MVFGIGQKHSMNYNTPYGIIEMDILTNNLEKNIDEKLITLKVEYDLNMENQLLSKSVIEYNIEYI